MPVIKSCLCFKTLKKACVASGIYVIVMAILELIATITYLAVYSVKGWGHSGLAAALDVILVLIQVLTMISGILLLEGGIKGDRGQSLMMVAAHSLPIPILFEIGAGIYLLYHLIKRAASPDQILGDTEIQTDTKEGYIAASVVVFLLWLVHLFFMIMCELSAVSYYQYLRKKAILAQFNYKAPTIPVQNVQSTQPTMEEQMSHTAPVDSQPPMSEQENFSPGLSEDVSARSPSLRDESVPDSNPVSVVSDSINDFDSRPPSSYEQAGVWSHDEPSNE